MTTTCRICANEAKPVIDFGPMPLANGWHDPARLELLTVLYCSACQLYQLGHVLSSDTLFADYDYRAGTSSMQRMVFADLAGNAVRRLNIGGDDRVIDIGGNDSSLLEEFASTTSHLMNIDPYAPQGTFYAVRKPWGTQTASELDPHYGRTLLTATNVWAHLPDQHDAMEGVARALSHGGWLIVQMPWHRDLFKYHLYDTIYHEHVYYYGIPAFRKLCTAHGLTLTHVDYLPDVHGGTLRYWVSPTGTADDSVHRLTDIEIETQVQPHEIMWRASYWREKVKRALQAYPAYWAVGCSAKAVMSMAMTETHPERIFDDTPTKIGKRCPGLAATVESLASVEGPWPDVVLVTAWNYKHTLTQRIRRFGYIGPVLTFADL